MRLLMINLLAAAVLLLGASSASAYAIYLAEGGTSVAATTSDTVSVTVFVDVDAPGVEGISIGVMYDADILEYVPGSSSAASYILYSPNEGKGKPSVYMTPPQNPPSIWPGTTPPNTEQVNVNFIEVNLGTTRATGLGIYLATLVFHVEGVGDGSTGIDLTLTAGGNLFRVNGTNVAGDVAIGSGVTVVTPEPTTAILVGLGLVGLGVAGRRRS